MYFMPQTNWLCSLFAPLKSEYRYGLTAIFLSSIFFGWYFGIYCQIARKITIKSFGMADVCTQSKSGRAIQSAVALEVAVTQVHCALLNYNAAWKTAGIELLLGYITKSGLVFISSDIVTKNHEFGCLQDSISLHVAGSLKDCSTFFSLLSSSGTYFICQQIDIAATDTNLYKIACVITVLTADKSSSC